MGNGGYSCILRLTSPQPLWDTYGLSNDLTTAFCYELVKLAWGLSLIVLTQEVMWERIARS
jgi:hypothetical protein